MEMGFYWVKGRTCQRHFFVYWGPGKTNKADYFTKHNSPSHHTVTRHEYPHKKNQSLSFALPRWFIDNGLGLTSTTTSHDPGGPKSDRKEPRYLTSDCTKSILNNIYPNYNYQEPGGSKYEHLMLIINSISHINT